MSPRDWRFRLLDIQSAARTIQAYVQDRTWETFEQDSKTQDAVIRQLTVLGEAAYHVPPEVMEIAPEVPWNAIRGLRNVVVHEYFGISLRILWNTASKNIPELEHQVESLLERLKSEFPDHS